MARLAGGGPVPDGFRVTPGAPVEVGPGERRIDVDQTNDSWVVGEAVVVKWVTDPLRGPHPAPERLRRLDAAGFAATPRLRGLVEWRTPEGHWVPVVMVTDVVPDATDGWTWCREEARLALGLRAGEPVPFAARLGELTAAMHRALADGPTGPVADHGDYHVGQVLRTPSGELLVIDFDGNPTLTPQERVAHRPAAYDVAGMLVSLENVGHVVARYDPQLTEADVVAWTEEVQEEFLDAYREGAGDLLDVTLLEPFVLDQIHRELAYADSHLPRWRYVPEAALRRRGLA
jgi:maltokinase